MRANQVYQDYISDRHHTHMNATQVSSDLLIVCNKRVFPPLLAKNLVVTFENRLRFEEYISDRRTTRRENFISTLFLPFVMFPDNINSR